jgi:hypothetical protein
MTPKAWLAQRLRFLADRLDPHGAPRRMGYSFTFEEREGIRFRDDARGCWLWYLGRDDYERAFDEADTTWEPPRPAWFRDMTGLYGHSYRPAIYVVLAAAVAMAVLAAVLGL